MAIGIYLPRGTAAVSSLTQPSTTKTQTHTHTSSETAACLLGVSLIFFEINILSKFLTAPNMHIRISFCFCQMCTQYTHTHALWRHNTGIHYWPAQWEQGHALRKSAFCQNWHCNAAAAAQDLCITLRLFILDIFSSVAGVFSSTTMFSSKLKNSCFSHTKETRLNMEVLPFKYLPFVGWAHWVI